MVRISLRKILALVFIVGGLASAYTVLNVSLQEEPIEGAGNLAKTGSSSVASVPKIPEVDREKKKADLTMTASYYGDALAGLPTASGEPFDPEGLTAAHKELPLGTELLVKRGSESVQVTVNDRGPYVEGRDLDLSVGAAQEIGLTGPGEDEVRVVLLYPAKLPR